MLFFKKVVLQKKVKGKAMKILNRAKSIYSDEYLISEDIKFELGLMYLRINGKWRECDKDTRSLNFEDMIDSQGNKIFASLSEDGKGGDIVDTTIGLRQNFITICLSSGVCVFTSDTSAIKNTPCKFILDYKHRGIKVVGIYQ